MDIFDITQWGALAVCAAERKRRTGSIYKKPEKKEIEPKYEEDDEDSTGTSVRVNVECSDNSSVHVVVNVNKW